MHCACFYYRGLLDFFDRYFFYIIPSLFLSSGLVSDKPLDLKASNPCRAQSLRSTSADFANTLSSSSPLKRAAILFLTEMSFCKSTPRGMSKTSSVPASSNRPPSCIKPRVLVRLLAEEDVWLRPSFILLILSALWILCCILRHFALRTCNSFCVSFAGVSAKLLGGLCPFLLLFLRGCTPRVFKNGKDELIGEVIGKNSLSF